MARILIVDDHAIVRRMLKALIETHEGWEVCGEAENGLEAIQKVAEYKPDLVIMDMAMPLKDGISASRDITSKMPSVPIVMHTLHYAPELELEAKKAGVRAVVPKAESGDELLKTIEGVLNEELKKPLGTEARAAAACGSNLPTTPGRQGDEGPSASDAPPPDVPKPD